MDPQSSYGKLDLKINVTLKRLDQLLALLDGYKPVLEHNASCAAVEIRANFDGLIDALYQRQVNLLKQLDKVYKEKITLIDSSKQTIEALRAGILSCVSTRHTSDSQIHDYIARSESVLLNSSSAPFLSFRAERSTLPQAIANYGRVVSRYSGHFADPSMPSTCLPLAVEAEDDHEESHEQTTMFTQVPGFCSCVKPHWRQWLFNAAHECSSAESGKGEPQKLTSLLFSNSDLTNQALCLNPSTCSGQPWVTQPSADVAKKGTAIPSPFSDSLWPSRFVTSRRHSMLRDFIQASGSSFRSRSHTLDTEDSDHTAATTSDSFTILTGSANGRMDDLKDWLFCDPTELGDMPGLSARLPSLRQKRSAVSEQFTEELASHFSSQLPRPTDVSSTITQSSAATADATSSSSLLPAHLLTSGPLDLSRWLRPQPEPKSAVMETESAPIVQERTDPPLEKSTDLAESQTVKRCPYAQCIGGPGGPTCCGARMQCFSADADTAMETTGTTNNNVEGREPPEPTAGTLAKSLHPVVAQLNQIAATHWTKWVGNKTAEEDLVVTGSIPDIQSWLQPETTHPTITPTQHDIEDFAAFEDSVLPPKRRSTEKADLKVAREPTVVVQSPFVCLSDPVDKVRPCSPHVCSRAPRKSAGATLHQPPMQTNHETKDDYEDWLLQKLSNLSTAADASPGRVDKWLTEHTSTPTVAETRPKHD